MPWRLRRLWGRARQWQEACRSSVGRVRGPGAVGGQAKRECQGLGLVDVVPIREQQLPEAAGCGVEVQLRGQERRSETLPRLLPPAPRVLGPGPHPVLWDTEPPKPAPPSPQGSPASLSPLHNEEHPNPRTSHSSPGPSGGVWLPPTSPWVHGHWMGHGLPERPCAQHEPDTEKPVRSAAVTRHKTPSLRPLCHSWSLRPQAGDVAA